MSKRKKKREKGWYVAQQRKLEARERAKNPNGSPVVTAAAQPAAEDLKG
jgi:hypothetical protein